MASAVAATASFAEVPIASYNKEVCDGERETAYRNTCLTYMMKEGEY